MDAAEPQTVLADRDLIERHVARVIVKPQALEVCLIPNCEASAQAEDPSLDDMAPCHPPIPTITLPWTAPSFAAVKGIIHAPGAKPAMRPESRDALLAAIAKARGWIDDIRLGRIGSFAEIAEREAQGERHIRLLSPRLPVAPHDCGDRRWHRACRPHGQRPRQGPALFVGRAGAEHRIVTRLVDRGGAIA
jgi:site-specific DNA recombinase